MLTVEDYKWFSNRAVQLAIASDDPRLAQILLELALDYMRQAARLESAATEKLRHRGQQDSIDGSEIIYRMMRGWMWASGHNGRRRGAHGYEPTREAAMAASPIRCRRAPRDIERAARCLC